MKVPMRYRRKIVHFLVCGKLSVLKALDEEYSLADEWLRGNERYQKELGFLR